MWLGATGVSVFAMTGLAGYFLRRPAAKIVYAGLDRQDDGRIAEALKESGIPFDVNSGGKPVLVRHGESAPAQFGKLENMTGDSFPLEHVPKKLLDFFDIYTNRPRT
jgi:hypothetical protein